MTPKKKSIPQLSIETQMLIKRMKKIEPGEFISYEELSELIGRNAQTTGYGSCTTARNRLLRDEGMVFAPVVNEGLKRLTEEEIAKSGTTGIAKIRSITKKEQLKLHLGVKNFEELSNDAKIAHNTSASMLGMFQMFSKTKSIAKIENAVIAQNEKIASMKILEMFK